VSKGLPLVPSGLRSAKSLLACRAFHQLVESLWKEDEERPGCGLLGENALAVLPELVEMIRSGAYPHDDRVAWLLGLLAEATDSHGNDVARDLLRKGVPVYLDAVDRMVRQASKDGTLVEVGGMVFLLGHFPEDAPKIVDRLGAVLGREAPAVQEVTIVFSAAAQRPERSKFVLTYLGAKAGHASLDPKSRVCENALACPACHGLLDYQETRIACIACGVEYGWSGDIPDLVVPGCADPEQYPEAIVGIYESQSRPRFVRTMAADWSDVVTPSREEAYLVKFLTPVEGPVLDLACGAGGWTKLVARHIGPSDVIALDYSMAMLKACSAAVPGISLVRASASALPFPDASLGGMNCSDALQALPDAARAFAEASRCLRPGAPFTVFTFREAASPYAYFQHRLPSNSRTLLSDSQIRELASNTGFDVVDIGGPGQALFFTVRKRA
jgi:SAM-dependent methyltransferase